MKTGVKIENMQLFIHGDRLISDVQQEFSAAFPFLKLEFFKHGIHEERRYPASMKLPNTRRIKDSWRWKKDGGYLEVDEQMTVLALEDAFLEEFGLCVQVFRKSGNIWLETTMTDHWTLQRQSDHGREISTNNKN